MGDTLLHRDSPCKGRGGASGHGQRLTRTAVDTFRAYPCPNKRGLLNCCGALIVSEWNARAGDGCALGRRCARGKTYVL